MPVLGPFKFIFIHFLCTAYIPVTISHPYCALGRQEPLTCRQPSHPATPGAEVGQRQPHRV